MILFIRKDFNMDNPLQVKAQLGASEKRRIRRSQMKADYGLDVLHRSALNSFPMNLWHYVKISRDARSCVSTYCLLLFNPFIGSRMKPLICIRQIIQYNFIM
jgi:hypothetical protein